MELDTGDARLDLLDEGEGPVIVALHGFPDSRATFREQVPALVAAGYRVIRPALRGYAPSGASRAGRYDVRSLARDVLAIADAFSPESAVRLLGHDWGALAAQGATALAPERVSHLATIAVPPPRLRDFLRPRQLRRSWYMAFFQLPGAERALLAHDGAMVARLWRDWSPGFTLPPELVAEAVAAVGAHPEAVLGYYRALPRTMATLRALPSSIPHLHLHGERDGCIGAEIARRLEPRDGITVKILPGGHFVHLESPAAVNRLLVDFFAAPADQGRNHSAR